MPRGQELIINAAGKNMSPANIEAELKMGSPLVGQAVTIGDRRPYNTALIVLDADYALQWAAQNGLDGKSLEELAEQPQVLEAVQQGVDVANGNLARVEQIKKFTIVPGDWAPGGDALTPTMKLKRKPIEGMTRPELAGPHRAIAPRVPLAEMGEANADRATGMTPPRKPGWRDLRRQRAEADRARRMER